jgi:Histidine kinase
MKLNYQNIWIRNFVFLLFASLIMYAQNTMIEHRVEITLLKAISANFVLFSFIFIHNYFCIDKLLLQRQFLKYGVAACIHFVIVNVFVYHFGDWFGKPIDIPFLAQLITIFMVHLIGVAFYFLHLSILNYITIAERSTLKNESEILYLKQQLNPHFLLNALNNLYGVSLSSPNDIPDKILELSDLLKYQINTSKKDWTSLREELNFIDQYMQYILWKSNALDYQTKTIGDVLNFQLSPMLFLPLIENAVKYSAHCAQPFIKLVWTFEPQGVQLSIENNFNPSKTNSLSTQTGIINLQRRLELYHPNSTLQLQTNQHIYTANLTLWKLSTVA